MKYNTVKRGLILVMIALCIIFPGVPASADEMKRGPFNITDLSNEPGMSLNVPYSGLFFASPAYQPGSKEQASLFMIVPEEVSATTTRDFNAANARVYRDEMGIRTGTHFRKQHGFSII